MKIKTIIILIIVILNIFILTGCTNGITPLKTDLSIVQSDIGTITVTYKVQVVGLDQARR